MTVLAIDIGGTKTLAALVEAGAVRAERRIATDIADGPAALVEAVGHLVAPWAGGYHAVGASVTGLVQAGRWRALNTATLDLRETFPLAEALAARLGAPAHCLNDAQAAAWGEFVAGAGRGVDMAFLTVSTGIGGGLVLDGRLRGGLAGSFGQFVDADAVRLEDRAAGRWLAAEAAALGQPADARAVFAAAGAPWAERLLDASAGRVAALCRNIQLAVEPQRIVIGGGIGLAPGYLDRLRAALAGLDPALAPRLVPAALGALAGVVGASAIAESLQTETSEAHRETAS